jgi:putative PIN family toxin of toxin-antitoxin system
MAASQRFVLDTNVVVSAMLLPRSIPRRALDKALTAGRLLVSVDTVAELNDVLRREHFDKYLREEERLEFLAALLREAELVDIVCAVSDCRDPKDNMFLELALSGAATAIVSGDDDLLTMHPFRGIPIVTSQSFVTQA